MSNGLKNKIASFLLKQQVKRLKRKLECRNIESAKSILIIWCDDTNQTSKVSFQLKESLQKQGKKVQVAHYVNEAFNEEELSIEDFSWLGVPKSEKIKTLIETDFDLLICLSTNMPTQLEHVIALSRAYFKIGWQNELFDMQIATDEVPTPRYLADQILIYLEMINK